MPGEHPHPLEDNEDSATNNSEKHSSPPHPIIAGASDFYFIALGVGSIAAIIASITKTPITISIYFGIAFLLANLCFVIYYYKCWANKFLFITPGERLAGRIIIKGYCGLYTVNRDDVHPIVGPTDIEGFWVANGFSGHGFKLAPAIGSMVAKSITGEVRDFDTDIPQSFFAIDRRPIELSSKSVLA